MTTVDDYIQNVIGRGDAGSRLLAARAAPTLKHSSHVDVVQDGMHGVAVLRIPATHHLVVHSASGDPSKQDIRDHSLSMVDRLVAQARAFGAEPVGFANVIDSRTGDLQLLETIAGALVEQSHHYKLALLNGENAILGERIQNDANVSGTMISIIPKKRLGVGRYGDTHLEWIVADHRGKAVYINSDGVGTKTEFYERSGQFALALDDSAAMKLDDASKLGAQPLALTDVIEFRGHLPRSAIAHHCDGLMQSMGIPYLITYEHAGNRLQGFSADASAYNVSGSVVSIIDEERLRNPPTAQPGDVLIAIRGKPNPRSNGITDKRRLMAHFFGRDWHETEIGKQFLAYLAQPSTIFFPAFHDLLERKLATSVYHMSGGAYNGKLARPLAKQGLFVDVEGLFTPDWRELFFVGMSSTSPETAYAKWPMGNEGFITTKNHNQAIALLQQHGLQAKVVGIVEKAYGEQKGVALQAFDGSHVYFSGRD